MADKGKEEAKPTTSQTQKPKQETPIDCTSSFD
jgi:hypothetical protein